ncbi:MAG: hypothetical protein V4717_05530 [Bacteroidota bacterium]
MRQLFSSTKKSKSVIEKSRRGPIFYTPLIAFVFDNNQQGVLQSRTFYIFKLAVEYIVAQLGQTDLQPVMVAK